EEKRGRTTEKRANSEARRHHREQEPAVVQKGDVPRQLHSRTETGSLRTGGLQQYCPVEARKPAEQPKACLLRPPTPDMLGSSQSKLLDRSDAARPPLERGAQAHLLELYS